MTKTQGAGVGAASLAAGVLLGLLFLPQPEPIYERVEVKVPYEVTVPVDRVVEVVTYVEKAIEREPLWMETECVVMRWK